jgi:CRP/FNR family transcriptional regulator, nitrogen fixation regulation protein
MLLWTSDAERRRTTRFSEVAEGESVRHVGDVLEELGNVVRYQRDAEIFGEDEPAECLYRVISGAIRVVRLMSDGRRQIYAFYFAGDMFGFDVGDVHRFSAEAITSSEVLIIRRSALTFQLERNPELTTELWARTIGELRRAQEHVITLGRKSAQERVADFLLDAAGPLLRSGAVELPMSRHDIADYLGLTIETVSRTLTQLQRDRVISITSSRRIVLRDRSALAEISDRLVA